MMHSAFQQNTGFSQTGGERMATAHICCVVMQICCRYIA